MRCLRPARPVPLPVGRRTGVEWRSHRVRRGDATRSLALRSPAFAFGDPIPARYTADGQDLSPPLEWSAQPGGTVELALILEDPDAPGPEPWVHWIICKVPADAPGLPEGIPSTPTTLEGLVQGAN